MRKVSIKELRKTLGKELDNLPFAITKRGFLIAQVTPCPKVTPEKCTPDNDMSRPLQEGYVRMNSPGSKVFALYSKEQQLGKKKKGRG